MKGVSNCRHACLSCVRRFALSTSTANIFGHQNGTPEHDYIDAAAAGPNGTYVFAGTTRGYWSATNAGIEDWVVFEEDAQRDILWTWQVSAGVCRT